MMDFFVGGLVVGICATIVLRARRRKVLQRHGRRPASNSWFV